MKKYPSPPAGPKGAMHHHNYSLDRDKERPGRLGQGTSSGILNLARAGGPFRPRAGVFVSRPPYLMFYAAQGPR